MISEHFRGKPWGFNTADTRRLVSRTMRSGSIQRFFLFDRVVLIDTALRLAHFFGTSAQFWPNLQNLYDLRLTQEKVGKSIKALPALKRRELVHA